VEEDEVVEDEVVEDEVVEVVIVERVADKRNLVFPISTSVFFL
jgi:hypothetical protein